MPTFDAGDIQSRLTLDRDPFDKGIEQAIRRGRDFSKMVFEAILDLNTKPFDKKMDAAVARAEKWAKKEYRATLDANTAGVTRAVRTAEAELNKFAGKTVRAKIDVDVDGAKGELRDLENEADRVGTSIASGMGNKFQQIKIAGIFSGVTLGAAAGPSLLTAFAGGIGAVGLAALGTGSALKAYADQQKAVNTQAAGGNAAAVSQAISLRKASEAIKEAKEAQSRAAEDSADRVEQANDNVVESERDYQRAVEKTTEARKDAVRSLEDMIERVSDYALTQEGATIAEMRALENQKKINEDAASSDLDKREAAYEVAEAHERLSDVYKDTVRDTKDLNEMQKKGIEGSDQVVSAKEAERNALNKVNKANEDLAKAQRDAERSRIDAERNVAKAVQDMADIQARANEATSTAAKKVNLYEEALKKLTPQGREFVKQLISMKDNLDQLGRTSQRATLPGWTSALQALQSMAPTVNRSLGSMGTVISDTGDKAAALMRNPLFQGEFETAFKNAEPVLRSTTDGLVELGGEIIKFGSASAPIARGTADLIDGVVGGLGNFFDALIPKASEMGSLFSSLGTMIEGFGGTVGTVAGQFAAAWDNARGEIESTFSKLSEVFTAFSGSGLSSFSDGVKIVLDVFKFGLQVIEPFAGFLGGLTGTVGAALIAWKLFGGILGKTLGLFTAFAPATFAGKLSTAAAAVGGASVIVDKSGKAMTTAEGATSKYATSFSKVGNAAIGAAKYIPLIGVAVAAASSAFESAAPSAEDLAKGLMAGGEEAEKARGKIDEHSKGLSDASLANKLWGASADEVRAKLADLRSSMTPLQRAEGDVAQAQANLTLAEKRYGEGSPAARAAADIMSTAVSKLKDQQWQAAQNTMTHAEKLKQLQTQMQEFAESQNGYEGAMLGVERAQRSYNEAVATYGPSSLEAREAQNQYEQALLRSMTAAGQLSDAMNSGLEPSKRAELQTDAVNRQLAILAISAGQTLPPALQAMVDKLSDNELKAMGVKVEFDKLNNRVLTMSPGKNIEFQTNAPDVKKKVEDLDWQIGTMYGNWARSYLGFLGVLDRNPAPNTAGFGLLPQTGSLAGIIPGRAEGGPVEKEKPYWVGERGPELVFPSQNGFVATHQQSKEIMRGGDGGSTSTGGVATMTPQLTAEDIANAVASAFAGGIEGSFDSGSLERALFRLKQQKERR